MQGSTVLALSFLGLLSSSEALVLAFRSVRN